ncbi:MAG TPA: Hsp70 family protein [Candidatus Angelobacter sp.]|nr:Hsp70 family protein [Candidatus Angelobacter sp.]
MSIGIDFGTTNSAIAIADRATRSVSLAKFDGAGETFRSVLYFEKAAEGALRKVAVSAGPAAIEHYLKSDHEGRFIQSLKSYLSQRTLTATNILGRNYPFENLVAILAQHLRKSAESSLGTFGRRAVVGRPVRFVGSESAEDDQFAVARLRSAFAAAGFDDVIFEYEPVAAAYFYESQLDRDEVILVADFGGGTTDFSVLRVGPSERQNGNKREVLATEGIGLAGDAFDAKIVRHLVADLLGESSMYRSMGKLLQIPAWIYRKLERWHYLSFLKTRETIQMLKSLKVEALEPARIEMLITLIEEDLGFQLHRAVQRTKCELSEAAATQFAFRATGISIARKVTRKEFEGWIEEELSTISGCLDRLFTQVGLAEHDIDKVFLTGGSSFVPAVRRIFEDRFGKDKIAGGSEFTSVAKGLALRSLDLRECRN